MLFEAAHNVHFVLGSSVGYHAEEHAPEERARSADGCQGVARGVLELLKIPAYDRFQGRHLIGQREKHFLEDDCVESARA